MLKELKKLPQDIYRSIRIIGAHADKLKCEAFLVGGCVRDILLRVQNLDIDIVVEERAIDLARGVCRQLDAEIVEHKRFGTATINFPKPKKRGEPFKYKIDFATARSENYQAPASLPLVSFSSIREDMFRRDFTINSMAIQINRKNFGNLIDYFAGIQDLENGVIRVLHKLSFLDDPTRILRAIRFEQRYGFKMEAKTYALLKHALKFGIFEKLQKHRLRDELILLCKEPEPVKCLKRLDKLCSLDLIHPGLKLDKKTLKKLNSAQAEIKNFENHFPEKRQLDNWLIYLMALIEQLSLTDVKKFLDRFCFSRGIEKRIISFFGVRNRSLKALSKKDIKDSKVFKLLEELSYEVIIMLAALSNDRHTKEKIRHFFMIFNGMKINISGADLKDLGFKPGAHFKKILDRVLFKKIDGEILTHQEELEYLKKIAKKYADRDS